ncbi:putative cryptochrome [Xylariaceae sp. FL0255]|nr:putative cryptochrome [Xylariaceae sp. FL0255]
MPESNVLIYLVRHDLRVADNPILHQLTSTSDHGFTHLLPVYPILPHQIEVSGFLNDGAVSPYPEARCHLSKFWRTGTHRACFIAQSVWNLKENLTQLGSNLTIRIGTHNEILDGLVEGLKKCGFHVGAVWMVAEEGHEEEMEEKRTSEACSRHGIDFRAWVDEKYFIDDRDLKLDSPNDLPDVFTTYRKMNEPLRERPRATYPRPSKGSLPTLIAPSHIPDQTGPFTIPSTREAFQNSLLRPLHTIYPIVAPADASKSAHPFHGGETNGLERLEYLISSGIASKYRTSRNGLIGADFSTKLSAYLAQGCITARQIHEKLAQFEDGSNAEYMGISGYGQGENEGTKAIRFELLWRDYMRLCTRKFKVKLFSLHGFRDDYAHQWKPGRGDEAVDVPYSTSQISTTLRRVIEGSTGHSLVDASQRELIFTGYTSNRARQNVASFLTKHLNVDWRFGAEWYEMMLVDYDVNSNWSNWQYVAGVGNDPRGEARIFNPVKQAFDYDKEGEYVKLWIPEIRKLERLENIFQPWTTPKEEWERCGLTGLVLAEQPLLKIDFSVNGKPKSSRRNYVRRRGQGPNGTNRPVTAQEGSGSDTVTPSQPRNFGPRDLQTNYRGESRGGRGFGGHYRGRGNGAPRGGFQWARGGWQQYSHGRNGYAPQPVWGRPSDITQ